MEKYFQAAKISDAERELRAQFLPCNAAWLAREALKNLKQLGLVKDYVKAFCPLMLNAQSKSRRQDVKSLNSTIATTDRLMDYKAVVTSSGWKEEGGKRHLDNKLVDKGKETKVVQDGFRGKEHKDKKPF
ncbi:unnamed protein product [Prunus armeniaca]